MNSDEWIAAPRAGASGVAGVIVVPPSKSVTQRALVAAALAGPGAEVVNPLDAEDSRLLFAALRAAGFRLEWSPGRVRASGRDPVGAARMAMGNNGTGMRFLIAQLAGLPGNWRVDGDPRLRERPVAPLVTALRSLGAEVSGTGGTASLPLDITGRELPGGVAALDAALSSQFVSALLLLGARLRDGLTVRLPSPPPSRPYLDLTVEVLERFGSRVTRSANDTVFAVAGGQLRPAQVVVEGDWSAAAFPLCAAAVAGGRVRVSGVRRGSAQGDAVVAEHLAAAGCVVEDHDDGVEIRGPAERAVRADLRDAPDLFPALSVVVAVHGGVLTGLGGLAHKESDRLAVMTDRLRALGFDVAGGAGRFEGAGARRAGPYGGQVLDPAADHRVAMALAVAGSVVEGVRIGTPSCVEKSWPLFWTEWRRLLEGTAPA